MCLTKHTSGGTAQSQESCSTSFVITSVAACTACRILDLSALVAVHQHPTSSFFLRPFLVWKACVGGRHHLVQKQCVAAWDPGQDCLISLQSTHGAGPPALANRWCNNSIEPATVYGVWIYVHACRWSNTRPTSSESVFLAFINSRSLIFI